MATAWTAACGAAYQTSAWNTGTAYSTTTYGTGAAASRKGENESRKGENIGKD